MKLAHDAHDGTPRSGADEYSNDSRERKEIH